MAEGPKVSYLAVMAGLILMLLSAGKDEQVITFAILTIIAFLALRNKEIKDEKLIQESEQDTR